MIALFIHLYIYAMWFHDLNKYSYLSRYNKFDSDLWEQNGVFMTYIK